MSRHLITGATSSTDVLNWSSTSLACNQTKNVSFHAFKTKLTIPIKGLFWNSKLCKNYMSLTKLADWEKKKFTHNFIYGCNSVCLSFSSNNTVWTDRLTIILVVKLQRSVIVIRAPNSCFSAEMYHKQNHQYEQIKAPSIHNHCLIKKVTSNSLLFFCNR